MIYKDYGTTGKKVSAVGFGGMRFDLQKSNAQNAKLVRYAFDNGINYFDTAPGYCNDRSEDIFGAAIAELKTQRDKFFVSTKAMPTEHDTVDKTIAAVEKSLKRLNVEKIDFYHIWCIRTMGQYELATKPAGQYAGLLKCKEKGLIGHICISTHLRGEQVASIVDDGLFDGVLLGVNIINFPFRWAGVAAAAKANMGVVAMNPLAGGIIVQSQKHFGYLKDFGDTPVEAALRFCVSCPQITVALNGFTAKEHIETACRAADNSTAFSDGDIEQIKRHISKNMDSLCTGCGYCLGLCPVDIPIPNYMQFYNEKLLADRTAEQMKEQLDRTRKWGILVERAADACECVECGRCENACTQHLPIISRLKQISEWEEV